MDEQWWKQHGSAVKRQLTLGEAQAKSQPQFALRLADEVEAVMEEHGYPDWWSRLERLRRDAEAYALWG
jgi:hypothetical protein